MVKIDNKRLTNLFLRFLSAGREVRGQRDMNEIMYKQTVVDDMFVSV